MKADIDAGRLILDPSRPGHVAGQWIGRNWVHHAHARAAVPANPVNTWGRHPDGSPGRGIQYPFMRCAPDEYVAPWEESKLEPWKNLMRQLLAHHARHGDSPMRQISCEHIPNPDYGGGHKYSIFENNVACARWLRAEWATAQREAAGHSRGPA
jgi:hypothetical protein